MIQRLLNLCYPPVCHLCDSRSRLQGLCDECLAELPKNHTCCPRCALPLLDHHEGLCGQCLKSPPSFQRVFSPYLYADPLKWLIHRLKYNQSLTCVTPLAEAFLDALGDVTQCPDCIMPVPLHKRRLKQRGFNQATEIMRPVARHLGIPLDCESLTRVRHTPAQSGMNARQRKHNLHQAFAYQPQKQYRHVVLFDDVVTTGSTIEACARCLKRAGVEQIDVWSLARVPDAQMA